MIRGHFKYLRLFHSNSSHPKIILWIFHLVNYCLVSKFKIKKSKCSRPQNLFVAIKKHSTSSLRHCITAGYWASYVRLVISNYKYSIYTGVFRLRLLQNDFYQRKLNLNYYLSKSNCSDHVMYLVLLFTWSYFFMYGHFQFLWLICMIIQYSRIH